MGKPSNLKVKKKNPVTFLGASKAISVSRKQNQPEERFRNVAKRLQMETRLAEEQDPNTSPHILVPKECSEFAAKYYKDTHKDPNQVYFSDIHEKAQGVKHMVEKLSLISRQWEDAASKKRRNEEEGLYLGADGRWRDIDGVVHENDSGATMEEADANKANLDHLLGELHKKKKGKQMLAEVSEKLLAFNSAAGVDKLLREVEDNNRFGKTDLQTADSMGDTVDGHSESQFQVMQGFAARIKNTAMKEMGSVKSDEQWKEELKGKDFQQKRALFDKDVEIALLQSSISEKRSVLEITKKAAEGSAIELEELYEKAAELKIQHLLDVIQRQQDEICSLTVRGSSWQRENKDLRQKVDTMKHTADTLLGKMDQRGNAPDEEEQMPQSRSAVTAPVREKLEEDNKRLEEENLGVIKQIEDLGSFVGQSDNELVNIHQKLEAQLKKKIADAETQKRLMNRKVAKLKEKLEERTQTLQNLRDQIAKKEHDDLVEENDRLENDVRDVQAKIAVAKVEKDLSLLEQQMWKLWGDEGKYLQGGGANSEASGWSPRWMRKNEGNAQPSQPNSVPESFQLNFQMTQGRSTSSRGRNSVSEQFQQARLSDDKDSDARLIREDTSPDDGLTPTLSRPKSVRFVKSEMGMELPAELDAELRALAEKEAKMSPEERRKAKRRLNELTKSVNTLTAEVLSLVNGPKVKKWREKYLSDRIIGIHNILEQRKKGGSRGSPMPRSKSKTPHSRGKTSSKRSQRSMTDIMNMSRTSSQGGWSKPITPARFEMQEDIGDPDIRITPTGDVEQDSRTLEHAKMMFKIKFRQKQVADMESGELERRERKELLKKERQMKEETDQFQSEIQSAKNSGENSYKKERQINQLRNQSIELDRKIEMLTNRLKRALNVKEEKDRDATNVIKHKEVAPNGRHYTKQELELMDKLNLLKRQEKWWRKRWANLQEELKEAAKKQQEKASAATIYTLSTRDVLVANANRYESASVDAQSQGSDGGTGSLNTTNNMELSGSGSINKGLGLDTSDMSSIMKEVNLDTSGTASSKWTHLDTSGSPSNSIDQSGQSYAKGSEDSLKEAIAPMQSSSSKNPAGAETNQSKGSDNQGPNNLVVVGQEKLGSKSDATTRKPSEETSQEAIHPKRSGSPAKKPVSPDLRKNTKSPDLRKKTKSPDAAVGHGKPNSDRASPEHKEPVEYMDFDGKVAKMDISDVSYKPSVTADSEKDDISQSRRTSVSVSTLLKTVKPGSFSSKSAAGTNRGSFMGKKGLAKGASMNKGKDEIDELVQAAKKAREEALHQQLYGQLPSEEQDQGVSGVPEVNDETVSLEEMAKPRELTSREHLEKRIRRLQNVRRAFMLRPKGMDTYAPTQPDLSLIENELDTSEKKVLEERISERTKKLEEELRAKGSSEAEIAKSVDILRGVARDEEAKSFLQREQRATLEERMRRLATIKEASQQKQEINSEKAKDISQSLATVLSSHELEELNIGVEEQCKKKDEKLQRQGANPELASEKIATLKVVLRQKNLENLIDKENRDILDARIQRLTEVPRNLLEHKSVNKDELNKRLKQFQAVLKQEEHGSLRNTIEKQKVDKQKELQDKRMAPAKIRGELKSLETQLQAHAVQERIELHKAIKKAELEKQGLDELSIKKEIQDFESSLLVKGKEILSENETKVIERQLEALEKEIEIEKVTSEMDQSWYKDLARAKDRQKNQNQAPKKTLTGSFGVSKPQIFNDPSASSNGTNLYQEHWEQFLARSEDSKTKGEGISPGTAMNSHSDDEGKDFKVIYANAHKKAFKGDNSEDQEVKAVKGVKVAMRKKKYTVVEKRLAMLKETFQDMDLERLHHRMRESGITNLTGGKQQKIERLMKHHTKQEVQEMFETMDLPELRLELAVRGVKIIPQSKAELIKQLTHMTVASNIHTSSDGYVNFKVESPPQNRKHYRRSSMTEADIGMAPRDAFKAPMRMTERKQGMQYLRPAKASSERNLGSLFAQGVKIDFDFDRAIKRAQRAAKETVGTHYRRKQQVAYRGYYQPQHSPDSSRYATSTEFDMSNIPDEFWDLAPGYVGDMDSMSDVELEQKLKDDHRLDTSTRSRVPSRTTDRSNGTDQATPRVTNVRKRLSHSFQGGRHDFGMDISKGLKLSPDEIELLALSGIAKMDKGVHGRESALHARILTERRNSPNQPVYVLSEDGNTNREEKALELGGKNIFPNRSPPSPGRKPIVRAFEDDSDAKGFDMTVFGTMSDFLSKSERKAEPEKSKKRTLHTRAALGENKDTGGDLTLNVEGMTPLTASVPKSLKTMDGSHRLSPDSMPYVKAKPPSLPPPGRRSPSNPQPTTENELQYSRHSSAPKAPSPPRTGFPTRPRSGGDESKRKAAIHIPDPS